MIDPEWVKLWLEATKLYLTSFFSWPTAVIASVVMLRGPIAKAIEDHGVRIAYKGAEISMAKPQASSNKAIDPPPAVPPPSTEAAVVDIPPDIAAVEEKLRISIMWAEYWHFLFLDSHYAKSTKAVLLWLDRMKRPVSEGQIWHAWGAVIANPVEQSAVLLALRDYWAVQVDGMAQYSLTAVGMKYSNHLRQRGFPDLEPGDAYLAAYFIASK
jgi:hypothetical protein